MNNKEQESYGVPFDEQQGEQGNQGQESKRGGNKPVTISTTTQPSDQMSEARPA
jgi:hypothetical protein